MYSNISSMTDINEGLDFFIEELSKIGVNTFYVHARIALLKGLDPKENRTIPPLNYERVFQIKKDFKHLNIVINGGIEDFQMAKDEFQKLDGIMVGRATYDLPLKLFDVDRIFYNSKETKNSLISVIDEMFEYIDALDFKDEIKTKFHMLNLFKGLNNAKKIRLLLLSNEENDKIKRQLKNNLLANENQAA